MKKLLHMMKKNRIIADIGFVVLIAFVLMIPMFGKNVDIYYDDGSQHLMRAFGTYQSILKNGNGNIISNFSNDFGYSWDLFYGPLSADLIIIISTIIGNFNIGFKITMSLIMIFAGIFMYKFVHEMTENKNTALLSGVIYITSPYLFTDIYIRHAVGECMAFVFLPMVFLGLYNLFNTEKNHYYLIFGASGLILSHNISTVLTAIFAGIYLLVNIKNLASSRVKKGLALDIIFILLITSFYWIPFWETKNFTDYRVYENGAMTTKESFLGHALEIKKLFITPIDTLFVFEIGMPVIIMLVFSIMAFRRLEENKKEYIFFLVAGILATWMSTKYFLWKWLSESLLIIQFPWRMLVFSSFFFAIIASINMSIVIKKFNVKDVFVITVICIVYIFSRHYVIQYAEEVTKVENYQILNVTGQNNEWLPGMGRLEYLPSKAYNNTFYIATRPKGIAVLDGNAKIEENFKIGTHMSVKVFTEAEKTSLELPYIYYPGYEVRFDGIVQETCETENGFLGVTIENNENGVLEVKYIGTRLMNISKIISICAVIVYIIYVWKKH